MNTDATWPKALSRRAVLGGAGALLAAPALARSAQATRGFSIFRDGAAIGRHVITLSRDVRDLVTVDVDIDIAVKLLGFTAYSYRMRNTETWEGQRLQSVDSQVAEDDNSKRTRVTRMGRHLRIDGDDYQGDADGRAVTTSYFTPAFLQRNPWINTDNGEKLEVTAFRGGTRRIGGVACARWRVTDQPLYMVEVFYTPQGEWAGMAFDLRGQAARYQPDDLNGRLAEIWAG